MSTAEMFARVLALAAAFIAVASIAAYAHEGAPQSRSDAPLCCIYLIF